MRLERSRAQLLIVDVQERLLPAMAEPDRVLAGCERLIRAARRLDIPITLSEQYPKGLGPTVAPLREAVGAAGLVLEKVEFSCRRNATIARELGAMRSGGRDQTVVCGIEAHVCVTQTVLDLLADGAPVAVVADAVGSRRPASAELALRRLAAAGADIVDTEMVIFEWLDRAGTPEFKELQGLVK